MRLLAVAVALILAAPAFALTGRQEIVLIIEDDVPAYHYGKYAEPDAFTTPKFDDLADNGIYFLNAASEPACAPTRRDIVYGMTPLQHGAGDATLRDMPFGEAWPGRLSLVHQMQQAGWLVKLVGKFHLQEFGYGSRYPLGTGGQGSGGTTPASLMGFDEIAEHMEGNPGVEYPDTAGSPPAVGYNHHYNWVKTDPATGISSISTTYTTDAFTAAAVAMLQDATAPTTPTLIIIAYSGPHNPQSPPPLSACAPTTDDVDNDCYEDALEYVDTSIQDIVDEMDWTEDIMIRIGDNGAPTFTMPSDGCGSGKSAKGTPSACGTRVPMAIRGVGVTVGGTVSAPVGAIDLYATLLELAGGVSQSSESKSFVDCFANPTTCTPRAVASSIIFSESHVPVPMYDTQVFENYGIYLTTVEAGNLYGLRRDFDDNTDPTNSDNWADILYDLGSSTVIDEAKRYDQSEITSPDANAIIARDRMTTEITRLIAARWATHANSMIGVTMTGVSTR